MIKLLIGGSPCTYWSIAQKNNRETEPSGMGWELFENYLIAKEKFKPDFFLYENNKSAAQAIKDEIKKRLEVWDGTLLMPDSGARYIEINSALVSAQNRQRFYVHNCGEVGQPADRGILLKDILETGQGWTDKSYAMTATYSGAIAKNTTERHQRTMVAEPVCVAQRGRYTDTGNRSKKTAGNVEQYFEAREDSKTNALTTVQKDNGVAVPVRVGTYPRTAKNKDSKPYRIYSEQGKATTLCGEGGGMGAKTGLHAIPCLNEKNFEYIDYTPRNGSEIRINENAIRCNQIKNNSSCAESFVEFTDKKAQTVTTVHTPKIIDNAEKYNGKPIYEVRDGLITIKDKQYPIKLDDGFYIIRKLTVTECCRLQTMPDNYCRAVSATQGYRGLGNGWTAEVIIHILNGALKDVPKDEEIVVLSMYDGIGTGRYCLDKMGFTNVKYYAYEIDKFAIRVAMSNYPDIVQCGDAFQVRQPDWKLN